MERHRMQETRMFPGGGFRQRAGTSLTSSRRVEGEMMMVREVEELRTRTVQMEKTLR